ncbi:hypothetical protein N7G274_000641 [Stereocaulon virgatum]|uniref:ARM repeat-containing protein n=1 Tax=Stereocaulon virgatum TaxID=373712 RepID=A0ABR4ASH7_9LECA
MFDSLIEHFDSVGIRDADSSVEGWRYNLAHAEDEGADPHEALANVQYILQLLYLEKIDLSLATKILADGSRVEKWRLAYGEAGILEFFLKCLRPSYRGEHNEPGWTSDALRLIGNCCADLDANRERVLAWIDLPFVIEKLRSDEQADLAIAVLCNFCFDYEPAQKAARAHQLFSALVALIDSKDLNQDLLSRICQLLEFASDEFNPETCPDNSVAIIYKVIVTRDLEIEDQLLLSNSIVALLKHERFHKLAIVQDVTSLIIHLIVFSYTQDQKTISDTTILLDPRSFDTLEPGGEDTLSAMRQSLLGVMWDLSALPRFAIQYPLSSDCVGVFVSWLRAWDSDGQLCACYVLRNLASSDEACTQMVQSLHVHEPLLGLLSMTTSVPVLGEALRLLKNLGLPAANREAICSVPEAIDIITSLWSRDFLPTVQHAAATSIRLLLKGCVPNINLFLHGYSTDRLLGDMNSGQLSRLFCLFEASRDLAARVELARILIEIWRTIHIQISRSDADHDTATKIIAQAEKLGENVAAPVVWMIIESENPSLVTEGWFGLTLMASSREGGEAVWKAIRDGEALASLKRTIADHNSESKDRTNALVLVNKLLQRKYADPSLETTLIPLLQGSTNSETIDSGIRNGLDQVALI